jgi:hypothetical protein
MKLDRNTCVRGLASLLGAAALFASGPALAATYKVGPTQQHQQLGAVAKLVKPGDVIELDGDATYAGGVVFEASGTPAAKITVRGKLVNGKRPVVSGGTNTIEARGDHYVFENLDLTAGAFRCFYHHAHDITLRGSVIHDCPRHGLLGADSDSGSLLLEYVEVYNCGGGGFDHQIYMATDQTAHKGAVFRMQFCYVHDGNGGNNVKSRAERNEIYYNWIQGAVYHELELIGPDGQSEALAREDSDVVGNVLLKTGTTYVVRFGGDGTGQTWGRYRFVNNTVITQPGGSAVFRMFDGVESVEMHNNVFTVAGAGGVNVLRTTEASWSSGSSQIAGSKNWVKTGSTNLPSQWTGTLMGADPGFVDQASLDIQLAAGSSVIDQGAGTMNGPPGYAFPLPLAVPLYHPPLHALLAPGSAEARPVAGANDPGAYEYGATSGSGGAGAGGDAGGFAGSTAGTGASTTGGTAGMGASTAGASGGDAGGGGPAGASSADAMSTDGSGGARWTGASGAANTYVADSNSDIHGGASCRIRRDRGAHAWPIPLFALFLLRRRSFRAGSSIDTRVPSRTLTQRKRK